MENPIDPIKRTTLVARRKTDPPGTNIPTRSTDVMLDRITETLNRCQYLLDSIKKAQSGPPR